MARYGAEKLASLVPQRGPRVDSRGAPRRTVARRERRRHQRNAAPAIAHGSFGVISNRNDFTNLVVANATGRPIAKPDRRHDEDFAQHHPDQPARSAPSAMRSPISLVRRATLYAIVP